MSSVPRQILPYDPFNPASGSGYLLRTGGAQPLLADLDLGPYSVLSRNSVDVYNVKAYGATGDGTGNDAPAINTAITAANAAGGGVVFFPLGHYRCTEPIVLYGMKGITLVGVHAKNTGGSAASKIQYDNGNTDARFIDARNSGGISIDKLYIYSNTSFAGFLVDNRGITVPGSYLTITNCNIGSTLDALDTLVSLEHAQSATITNNLFEGGVYQIRGKNVTVPSTWSNAHVISANTFITYRTAAICDAGEGWTIRDNTFENGYDAAPLAVPFCALDQTMTCSNLLFEGNWMGDGGTGQVTGLKIQGGGITIRDNYFGHAYAAIAPATHEFIKVTGTVITLNVTGNTIANNVDTFIDFDSQTVRGFIGTGNLIPQTTVGMANASLLTHYAFEGNVTATGSRVAGQSRTQQGVRAHATAAQSIPRSAYTVLTFDAESWDDDDIHPITPAPNNGYFTVPASWSGRRVEVKAGCFFVNAAGGNRYITIAKGATQMANSGTAPAPAGFDALFVATEFVVATGESISIQVYQNQTAVAPLDTLPGSQYTWVSIRVL
jgi:hypothetical protein